MGLSRNKVAVSEGAAGSPPFYGDNNEKPKADRSGLNVEKNRCHLTIKASKKKRDELRSAKSIRCSIFEVQWKHWTLKAKTGGVAQLGEHLPCKQGVMGSNPIISTNT